MKGDEQRSISAASRRKRTTRTEALPFVRRIDGRSNMSLYQFALDNGVNVHDLINQMFVERGSKSERAIKAMGKLKQNENR